MPQGNAELFRRLMESANLPDPEPELAALLAPDHVVENATTAVTDKTYYGVAGCVEWKDDMRDGFAEGARCVVEEIYAETDDAVVGRTAWLGTGARSGAPLELRWVTVTWFRDGKATRTVGYTSRREALGAVGLPE